MSVSRPPECSPRLRISSFLVLFTVLSIGIGQSLTFALLAPLGREVGLKETQVGLIVTCASLVFTVCSPVWGRRCDRWGRKPVLLIGQLGYAMGTTLFASVFLFGLKGWLAGTVFYLLILSSRMLMASLTSAVPGAASAYIADTTAAEERVAGMGRLGAANNLGTVLGPAVSGVFAALGLLVPMYIAAGITLIGSILIALLLKEPARREARETTPPRLSFRDRRYFPFIVVGLFTFTAFAAMTQTIGFYLQDRFLLDGKTTAQAIGFGFMVTALASVISQGYLVRRFTLPPSRLLKIGLPVLVVGYGVLPFGGSIHLTIAIMGIIGVGMGMVGPGITAGASIAVGQKEQGAIGGLISASSSGGYVLGPILGTFLFQLNPSLPYFCCCALLASLLVYVWRLKRKACSCSLSPAVRP